MAGVSAGHWNLDKFQCLFNWDKRVTDECDPNQIITVVKDKLLTSDCAWRTIIYHLVLCYENSVIEENEVDGSPARSHLTECENILQTAEWLGDDGALVQRTRNAIQHVIYSSWAHLVLTSQTVEELKDYISQIPVYKALSRQEKGAVWGIHAACLMQYGQLGCKTAAKCILQAIQYDTDEPEWHYLHGEILRRERFYNRDEEMPPSTEEIQSLEKAVILDRDKKSPAYVITLASSLYDTVQKEKDISLIRDQATALYRSALERWGNLAYVQLMCASGLLEYKYPVRNTVLANECLQKALRLAPNSCHVNLVAATFYWWPSNKRLVAVGYLAKAKVRYAEIVDKIVAEQIKSYRSVLRQAVWSQ